MPTHALLGATGNTGAAILRSILSDKSHQGDRKIQLNVLVRDERKLRTLFPNINEYKDINILVGPLSNTDLLIETLRDGEVVYNCIGTNELRRDDTLDYSTAGLILDALRRLKTEQGKGFETPTILWNRTIGLNPQIRNPVPAWIEGLLFWAVDWAFSDKRLAQSMYEEAGEEGLMELICVDAPKLFEGEGRGYKLVTEGSVKTGLYYGDLGEAFWEVARRRGEFAERGAVGVGALESIRVNPFVVVGSVVKLLVRGLMVRLLGV